MRSKRVDSVNSGLKHIKKCRKGSGPPSYGLKLRINKELSRMESVTSSDTVGKELSEAKFSEVVDDSASIILVFSELVTEFVGLLRPVVGVDSQFLSVVVFVESINGTASSLGAQRIVKCSEDDCSAVGRMMEDGIFA